MAEVNIEKMVKNVAEKALDEFLYQGKSIREWMQIITSEDAISRQAVNILVDELARAISDERCCMSRGRSTASIMQDILDLPSVKPQEPFNIETYCKEHFCVMVDKDLWEKAEKTLKQEPVLDKISAEIDIARFIDKDTKLCKNANASGLEVALQIIDKYRESEDKQ